LENGLSLSSRSVMGVEIPMVSLDAEPVELSYGFMNSSALIDEAYIKFDRVKKLTAELAEVENSVYRLATAVNKTQKRANALKNIIIPRLTATSKFITDSLEEKEREDFSRLKVIKAQKNAAAKAAAEADKT
jgi:V/A-type H+-transporting ATPase subunit D